MIEPALQGARAHRVPSGGFACQSKAIVVCLRPLQAEATSGRHCILLRISAAFLMLGLWLGLMGLSVSERLHQALHEDAGHAHHECLVVNFAKAQFLHLSVTALVSPGVPGTTLLSAVRTFHPLPRFDLRLQPGRAPPV